MQTRRLRQRTKLKRRSFGHIAGLGKEVRGSAQYGVCRKQKPSMKNRVADIRYVMYTNDLRSTLQQSSMQQQLQQHPSGEAAAVLMRLTWALSKSFRVPRSCGSKKKELVIMLAIRAPRLSRRDFCCGCGSSVLSQSARPRLARRPAAAAALAGRAGTRGTPPTGRRERAACRSISWGIGHPLRCAKA